MYRVSLELGNNDWCSLIKYIITHFSDCYVNIYIHVYHKQAANQVGNTFE